MAVKDYVHLSALILAIINGLILFWRLSRDRPKLRIRPVDPAQFQWWFRLPSGEHEGQPTRRYGFLAYVCVTNAGLRDVALDKWSLKIKTKGGEKLKLLPISLPEAFYSVESAENRKLSPVLTRKIPLFEGSSMVKSGASVSGMAYCIAEVYGSEGWDPPIAEDGTVEAKFKVRDVFGNEISCKIGFSEVPLRRAEELVPGIATIG